MMNHNKVYSIRSNDGNFVSQPKTKPSGESEIRQKSGRNGLIGALGRKGHRASEAPHILVDPQELIAVFNASVTIPTF